MLTIRLKSENGMLKCEYSEMEKPLNKTSHIEKHHSHIYTELNDKFESSFQPITLSEEAREYLMAIYTSSFGFEAALLPDELSGKSTECFEVKRVEKSYLNFEKQLHLKSVADNVVADVMNAEQFLREYFPDLSDEQESICMSFRNTIKLLEAYKKT